MTPHLHSIKSNARREARKAGLDPETTVRQHAGGKWYVQQPTLAAHINDTTRAKMAAPPAAKPKRASAKAKALARIAANKREAEAHRPSFPRSFTTYASARAAADAAAERLGLKPADFAIVALPEGRNEDYADGYGFLPAGNPGNYVIVTRGKPRAEPPKAAKPAKKSTAPKRERSAGKARDAGGAKGDALLAILLAPTGAAMPDICRATGWLPHTARARISGLAQKHGLTITRKRLMNITWYCATKAKAA